MKYRYYYSCDSCHATREIEFDTERVGRHPQPSDIPLHHVCGVRGCQGTHTLQGLRGDNETQVPPLQADNEVVHTD